MVAFIPSLIWKYGSIPALSTINENKDVTMPEMTTDQKRECLDLASAIDRVKMFPGGTAFVTDLFLAAMTKVGLTIVEKAEYDQLVAAAECTK